MSNNRPMFSMPDNWDRGLDLVRVGLAAWQGGPNHG
jgi:hypothetical protein